MAEFIVNRKTLIIDKNAIFIYLLFFFSNDTYLFGTNANENMVTLSRVLLIFFSIFALFYKGMKINIVKNKGKLRSYFVLVGMYVAVAVLNHEFPFRVTIKLLCITVALSLSIMMTFSEFINSFRKAMFFLSWTAVLFTLFAYLSPGFIRLFPTVVNTAGTRIYTCGFAGLLEGMVGKLAVRTQGIFWEPGVFQIYLNLTIVFELFLQEKINLKYLIVNFLALFLTFSTTGFVVAAWIIGSFALFMKREGKGSRQDIQVFLIAMFILCLVVALLLFTDIGVVVFGKIINPTSSGTAMVRLAGVITNIEIAIQYPLHGIGMENISNKFLELSMASKYILGFTNQNTNTLLYQFAAHGIPYGVLFTIGTFKFGKWFGCARKIIPWCIFIAIVLMYVGENLQYSSLPYILIFYGYGYKNEILYQRNSNKLLDTQSLVY